MTQEYVCDWASAYLSVSQRLICITPVPRNLIRNLQGEHFQGKTKLRNPQKKLHRFLYCSLNIKICFLNLQERNTAFSVSQI